MTKQQIIDCAKHLSRDEQIDLAVELWGAVGVSDVDFPLTDAHKAELDRRLAEAHSNPQPPEEAESLKARLLRGEF